MAPSIIGSSPGLLLVILFTVGLCRGDPAALEKPAWPFHASLPFADGIDFGVGQVRALDLALGGS